MKIGKFSIPLGAGSLHAFYLLLYDPPRDGTEHSQSFLEQILRFSVDELNIFES